MCKVHIINLGKMGGVERLFLQYLQDNMTLNDKIFCVNNLLGEEIRPYLKGRKITFVNRIINSYRLKYPVFLRKYVFQLKLWRAKPKRIIVWDLVPRLMGKPSRGTVIYYDHGCSWRYPLNRRTHNFFALLGGCIAASYAAKRVMELRFQLPCPINVISNRIKLPAKIYVGEKNYLFQYAWGSQPVWLRLKGSAWRY